MYRCPHCHDLSISAWTQLSPPFDGRTKCPTCGTEVKVAQRATNYLVFAYLLLLALLPTVFGVRNIDPVLSMILLVIVAFVQCRFVRYHALQRPRAQGSA